MAKHDKHDLLIFLLVDIKQAGGDMIELAGEINGLERCGRGGLWKLCELQEAITKAQQSLDCYRKASATGKDRMTREEFEAA